jgi:hypothetical protein
MNVLTEQQIENLLRLPPRPRAPRGLKERLIMQTQSTPGQPRQTVIARARDGWLLRWWPALVPAGLSLVCAVVLAVQQKEIRELKQAIQSLSANAPSEGTVSKPKASEDDSSTHSSAKQQEEIAQLKEQVGKLTAEISQLEQMRSENLNLRAQLAAPPSAGFTSEEMADMEKLREKAMSSQCVNNLKQLALAVRMWANDHEGAFPLDILSATNEINTPKIFACPADKERQPAVDWPSFNRNANCSYEWFAPLSTDGPNRVMLRCVAHGSIALCDGSVQADVGKTHPEWVVNRDGKLYFEPPSQ